MKRTCDDCGQQVHWDSPQGGRPGTWRHADGSVAHEHDDSNLRHSPQRGFRLNIALDNAAFTDDPGELARILADLADTLSEGFEHFGSAERSVRDVNGNTVGTWVIR